MRNNQLIAILVAVLFVVTMLAVWYTYQGNRLNTRLQELNLKLNNVGTLRNLMQGSYSEAVNYSHTHPDIIPVLQKLTNSAAQVAIPTPKPPGK